MKRTITKSFLALVGLIIFANVAMGQTVNRTRWIELTVTQGQPIKLRLGVDVANTGVEIVSGSTTTFLPVTGWTGFQNYTAGATTMRVYGDITGFDCDNNFAKITGLNASNNTLLKTLFCNNNQLTTFNVSGLTALITLSCSGNGLTTLNVSGLTALEYLYCNRNDLPTLNVSGLTALQELYCQSNDLPILDVSSLTALKVLSCYDNNFSTQALDNIYCALPQRLPTDNAKIRPILNSSSADYATVMATNKTNATGKNWKVQYSSNDTDIPTTSGTYSCPTVNMSRYIELMVTQGEQISLDLKADAANTGVKVVSGGNQTLITVGTNWTDFQNYTAGGTTMRVYGDIIGFDCRDNPTKITGINPSNNTLLKELFCLSNGLTTLNVSGLTALKTLICSDNQFSSLNVSGLAALENLSCSNNPLTTLDVSGLTALKTLNCSDNQLSSLNVSGCTALEELNCISNLLPTLNISGCIALKTLYCYDNQLSSLNVSGCTALEELNCISNPLTTLDVSGCIALKTLYCYDNNFSTQALDNIYCALPQRLPTDNAKIRPILNSSSADYATVMATTKDNATAKNWKVQFSNNTNIPTTTGTYNCNGTPPPTVNMDRYITLNVNPGDSIQLDLAADAPNTGVKVESGTSSTTLTVGTSWSGSKKYHAQAATMKVYGNVKQFDCSNNVTKIKGLDFSNNTGLTELMCSKNYSVTSLNVSGLTALTYLGCSSNAFTSINISGCEALETLYCDDNNLSACGLDSIFHQLPRRDENDKGTIGIQDGYDTNPGASTCRDTIATNRNWRVIDYREGSQIDIVNDPANYACPYFTLGIETLSIKSLSAKVYPNPVGNTLYIDADESIQLLQLYDMQGRQLLATEPQQKSFNIDLSTLGNGIYLLKLRTAKGTGEYKVVITK